MSKPMEKASANRLRQAVQQQNLKNGHTQMGIDDGLISAN